MRILVVDDDEGTAAIQALLLKRYGHDAHSCHYSPDAMALIEGLQPDVVLLDLSMPLMSGYDIAEELRQNPDLRPRCLIAITGYGRDSDRAKTAAAGFDFHLLKPVSWPELQNVLSAVVLTESQYDNRS